MNNIKFFLTLSFLALSIDSAHANTYSDCQEACAGDGLSCLNKCLAESNANNDGGTVQPQVEAPNGVIVNEGTVDTFDREQAADRLEGQAEERVIQPGERAIERPLLRRR